MDRIVCVNIVPICTAVVSLPMVNITKVKIFVYCTALYMSMIHSNFIHWLIDPTLPANVLHPYTDHWDMGWRCSFHHDGISVFVGSKSRFYLTKRLKDWRQYFTYDMSKYHWVVVYVGHCRRVFCYLHREKKVLSFLLCRLTVHLHRNVCQHCRYNNHRKSRGKPLVDRLMEFLEINVISGNKWKYWNFEWNWMEILEFLSFA